jgi:hypothetical protein
VFIYDKSEITIFDDTKIKISDNIYINGKGIDNHSETIILGNKIFLK